MAQSNLPPCQGEVSAWSNCFGKAKAGSYEYAGEFLGGEYHGEGTFTLPDGSKVFGEFKNGQYHGKITTISSMGSIGSTEVFENGKRIGFAHTPIAVANKLDKSHKKLEQETISTRLMCPEVRAWELFLWTNCVGTFTYSAANGGGTYVGEWWDGKRNGHGTFFLNGNKYVGEWEDSKRNGLGVQFLASGAIEGSGIWRDDVLVQRVFVDLAAFRGIPNNLNSVISTPSTQLPAELDRKREPTTLEPSELDLLRAEAEQAKREKTELEAQLAAAQQQTQTKPTAPLATQGKRVALVIGNAKYRFSPLNNPVNDATDMAASLRSVGFDVIEVKDATLKQMREATRRFADKLEVSDVGLVYYSGHGIEVKGKNYLIPVNADIRREYEVVDQAFDASNLLRMMESLQSNVKKRVNILIVDACRNNDLPKSWRSTNSGLARMDAPAGSFISFATAPGQVASDGQGRNSPYTKHLLNALKQPNVPIEQVFKQVRRNVMDETGGEQVPWENSSLIGDFYFTVKR